MRALLIVWLVLSILRAADLCYNETRVRRVN